MYYHKIEKSSIANGTGIRVVLWCSGCRLHCKGCHNPQTWDLNSGKLFDESAKKEVLQALNHSYIQGITLSGGHPLEPENLNVIWDLIKTIRESFPNKNIWLYTGYTLDISNFDINSTNLLNKVIQNCDVIVDGSYIEELRDISLPYCGSSNQRVIDIKQTINNNKITLLKC